MFKPLIRGALATVVFATMTANAAVEPIAPGGITSVELTSAGALTSLGVKVAAVGTATIDAGEGNPIANFPITGGLIETDPGYAFISHNGSGLSLSAGPTTVSLENFFIDTADSILTGDVFVNGGLFGPLALFSIQSDLRLLLTDAAATALNGVFGTALPSGLEIGIADVQLQAVPLPPALMLFVTALAGLGAMRRKQSTV